MAHFKNGSACAKWVTVQKWHILEMGQTVVKKVKSQTGRGLARHIFIFGSLCVTWVKVLADDPFFNPPYYVRG